MLFNDKIVLVTGASSGIGAAIAIKFAAEGAKVTLVGRNESKLKNVSEKCDQSGNKSLVILADVTKDNDVKKMINSTISHFGKLDVLVNNVGVGTIKGILDEDAMQSFDQIMAINLRSAVYATHLAAPHIIKTKGNIINISSMASSGIFRPITFAYCTSKAGLDHFTRCVALELGPKGVRVNSVNPGPVKTDFLENLGMDKAEEDVLWEKVKKITLFDRVSDPDEVADLVIFLASNKAKSITGATYLIDNGALLKRFFE